MEFWKVDVSECTPFLANGLTMVSTRNNLLRTFFKILLENRGVVINVLKSNAQA